MAFLLVAGLGILAAGAEAPPAARSSPEHPQIDIRADQADFDLLERVAVYEGHVTVEDPQMTLLCNVLTARWSETNKITGIVARGEVQIETRDAQGTNRAWAREAVYDAAKNEIEMTGQTRLANRLGTMWADRVIYDRTRNRMRARGTIHMIIPAEALRAPGLTNAPKGAAALPK
jgi:lipopolysaccharide transport protein LptA